MKRRIPVAVIATVSEVLAGAYTRAEIDRLMLDADIEPNLDVINAGNKEGMTRAYLQSANANSVDALAALGKALTEPMEVALTPLLRARITVILDLYGLTYKIGGYIAATGSSVISKRLEAIIAARDLAALQAEFDRVTENVESDPASAVTASCALLESLFKTYVEEEGLTMPSEQTLKPLWRLVRKNLNFDASAVDDDDDLRTILTGLGAIVEGIGSLRTHKGSAHGRGKIRYKLEPRHARLAAHSAYTLASFVLEAWEKQAQRSRH